MSQDAIVTVSIQEARRRLSALVQQVLAGKRVQLAKHGKPVVELRPVQDAPQRKPGTLKGKIWVSDDFDACAPELQTLFEDASADKQKPLP